MKSAIKIISINIGLLLAVAVVAELIFGNWLWGPDYRALNIPRNMSRTFDVERLYPDGGTITYSRDEHGFRGAYGDVSSIDILTLGGSTTNQLYVDDNKTWHAELARLFAADGNPLSVVNAGVDGQSSRGHLAVFDRWFAEIDGLKARYVLVYAGINDMALGDAEQYDDMRSPDIWRRAGHWLKNKSAIYDLYKTIKGMMAARSAKVVHGSGAPDSDTWVKWKAVSDSRSLLGQDSQKLDAFRSRLVALSEKIRAFGAIAIFVTQPSAEYRLRDGWLYLPKGKRFESIEQGVTMLFSHNAVVLDVCRELNLKCVDIAGNVSFETADFYDRIHNTDKGARKLARYLYDRLGNFVKSIN